MLEREVELGRIAELLDAAERQQGGVTIVEGEAGIGKSTLLAAAAQQARDRGFTVLEARGGVLESDFAFGLARQLFEPLLRRAAPQRRRALLADAAQLAAPALGVAPAGRLDAADAVFAAQHGLYWLVDSLASDAPLLLCVDDAHWSDAASLRWLVYLGRRLDGVAAAVLVGWRSDEPDSDAPLLETLRAQAQAHTIGLRPLTEQAAAHIVRDRLGGAADDAFCRACARACGGNPFLLGELLEAAAEQELTPSAQSAARVDRLGPAAVARSVLLRLSRLPPTAAPLAEAVAVLNTDATLPHAAALAELSADEAAGAAVKLQQARLLVGGEPLRFAHSILRAAVYERLPSVERGAAHGRAARILHGCGVSGDRVALHLLLALPGGGAWAVECLRAAAGRALTRGDPDAAVDLLRRAVAEDPDAPTRGPLTLELGRATRLAGRPGAIAHLRTALDLARSPADVVAAARELGGALLATSHQDEALAVFDAAIARLPAGERERRVQLEADYLTGASLVNTSWPRLPPGSDELWQDPERATAAQRVLLVGLAMYRWRRADAPADEIARAALAAWGEGRLIAEAQLEGVATFLPIHLLARLDRLDEAQAMIDDSTASVRARGGACGLAHIMSALGFVAYLRGSLSTAEAECRAALHTFGLAQLDNMVHYVLNWLVHTLIDRGELDTAERELAMHLAAAAPATAPTRLLAATRGKLRLEQGRPGEARADALAFLDTRTVPGTPGMPVGVRLIAAEACRRQDDPASAARLIDDELRAATAVGVPSAVGTTLRAKGVLVGGEDGTDLLRRSVAVLETSPRRLELASSLVELGAALRRARQPVAAREPLRRGLGLAHGCGAAPLAARAHAELLAAGARPRRLATTGAAALTATERRVADLACSGLSNRQIAQTLFVTRRTVETHLNAAYRKLAVTSRTELHAALT